MACNGRSYSLLLRSFCAADFTFSVFSGRCFHQKQTNCVVSFLKRAENIRLLSICSWKVYHLPNVYISWKNKMQIIYQCLCLDLSQSKIIGSPRLRNVFTRPKIVLPQHCVFTLCLHACASVQTKPGSVAGWGFWFREVSSATSKYLHTLHHNVTYPVRYKG